MYSTRLEREPKTESDAHFSRRDWFFSALCAILTDGKNK